MFTKILTTKRFRENHVQYLKKRKILMKFTCFVHSLWNYVMRIGCFDVYRLSAEYTLAKTVSKVFLMSVDEIGP